MSFAGPTRKEMPLSSKSKNTFPPVSVGLDNAPPIVRQVLCSPGQPLQEETRDSFESRFGYDFSKVRIHANDEAAESTAAVSAVAYAFGNDIVFGTRSYDAPTPEAKCLLAHELAHVVQQSRGGTPVTLDPHSALERDADHAAAAVVGGLPVAIAGSASKGLARSTAEQTSPGYAVSVGELKEPAVLTAIPGARGVPPKFPGYDGFVGGQVTYTQTIEGRGAGRYTVINESVKDAEWITIISPEAATAESVRNATNRKLLAALRIENNPKRAPVDPVEIGPGTKLRVIKDGPAAKIRIVVNLPNKVDPTLQAKLQAEAADVLKKSPTLNKLADPPEVVTQLQTFKSPEPAEPVSGSAPSGASGTTPDTSGAAPAEVKPPTPTLEATPTPEVTPTPEITPTPQVTPITDVEAPVVEPSPAVGFGEGEAGAGIAVEVAEFALSFVVQAAIVYAINLFLNWLKGLIEQTLLERDMNALGPAIRTKLAALEPKIRELQARGKVFSVISIDVQRRKGEHPGKAPPHDDYETTILGPVDVTGSPVPATRSQSEERLFEHSSSDWESRIHSVQTFSTLIDDPQKRAREQETAKAKEKLRQAAAKTPSPQTPPSAPTANMPSLLSSPGVTQPTPSFEPLPGAPGPSPVGQAMAVVAEAKKEALDLINRGEHLLSGSPIPGDDIAKFKQDEDIWRSSVTIAKNHFTDNGPDVGRAGTDEALNSDQFGGRLKSLRQTLGD
jgi:hypothetical protein